jgi:hypothetical protein
MARVIIASMAAALELFVIELSNVAWIVSPVLGSVVLAVVSV